MQHARSIIDSSSKTRARAMRPSAAAHYLLPCIGSTKSYLKHNHTVRKECTKYVARKMQAQVALARVRSRSALASAPVASGSRLHQLQLQRKKNHAPKDQPMHGGKQPGRCTAVKSGILWAALLQRCRADAAMRCRDLSGRHAPHAFT